MGRALVYVVLLGLVTGLVAGVAAFGLPLAAEGEVAVALPPAVAGLLLDHGIGLAAAATALGGALLAVLALVALLDLRRAGRVRRA
jgi:hypothetical protein